MSQTAGGSWQCYTCGYTQLSASAAPAVGADCPKCRGRLIRTDSGVRCGNGGCRHESDADAHALYTRLVAEWEADPEGFFGRVRARTARLRALEPVWR
ncbi:hypothetical protein RND61_13840 [Streptomyces sp. TRM76323]|uniref:Uncharacterized protein n=1 Tax=Streptomyces tamarix TaxID=3078565 RepID=A0ABU3QK68_9ACTN|nr:hypothetical protein [Streptomyces tamarix]MDT9683146.1 hypothetical protein [Streptomyces tamarix]